MAAAARRGDPAGWQRADLDEFALPASDPARARAGQALHWQFVRHDIPRLLLRRDRSPRLTVPTVLLGGAEDPATPAWSLRGGEAFADDLRVRTVPGAGRYLPWERPDVVAEAAFDLFSR